jgi:hypothetical protein
MVGVFVVWAARLSTRFPNTNHVGAIAVLGTKVYDLGDLTAVS